MLALRCQSILEQQFAGDTDAPGFEMQREGLGRLTWLYLRLLSTRQAIRRVTAAGQDVPRQGQGSAASGQQPPPIPGSSSRGAAGQGQGQGWPQQAGTPAAMGATNARELEMRLADLNRRLEDKSLGEDLRRSLTAQAELLQQRVRRRAEAEGKLQFLDAELARIEEQVELIREQALLSSDPESFSRRIDEIGATLSGTADWIAEQQRTLGAMDDLLGEAPAAMGGSGRSRQSQ
jgi:hypothetical protein